MSPPEGAAHPRPAGGAEVQQRLAYDRTLLASERTFAAWLRTGLSVAAGGIAVAHLVPEPSRNSGVALALGACFVLLGVGVMAHGARQFARLAGRLAGESGRAPTLAPRVASRLTLLVGVLLLAVLVFLWTHQGRPRPAVPAQRRAATVAALTAGRRTAGCPTTDHQSGNAPTLGRGGRRFAGAGAQVSGALTGWRPVRRVVRRPPGAASHSHRRSSGMSSTGSTRSAWS